MHFLATTITLGLLAAIGATQDPMNPSWEVSEPVAVGRSPIEHRY